MKAVTDGEITIVAPEKPTAVITAYIHTSVCTASANSDVLKHLLVEFSFFSVHCQMTKKGVYAVILAR